MSQGEKQKRKDENYTCPGEDRGYSYEEVEEYQKKEDISREAFGPPERGVTVYTKKFVKNLLFFFFQDSNR